MIDEYTVKKWIMEAWVREGLIHEKSYSHKPHLASLPYDLNTNDPKKLQERLDAINRQINNWNIVINRNEEAINDINQKIDDLKKENEEAEKNISELKGLYKEFDELDENVKEEALNMLDDIISEVDRLTGGEGFPPNPFNTKEVDYYYNDLNNFKELFKEGGLIESEDAMLLRLGNVIRTGTNHDQKFNNVIFELDRLADMVDMYENPASQEIMQKRRNYEFIDDYEEQISKNNSIIKVNEKAIDDGEKNIKHATRMVNDFTHEQERTETKLDKVENRNKEKEQ